MADIPAQLAAALRDRYVLARELGRGGMATVYLAQDLKHDRPVALKVLPAELAGILGHERFEREIRLAARLQHPHVLTVLDSGEAAGQLWFTMPFVEGESLRDRLNRERQLPVDEALRITREAAQGLQYAHEHAVVHRDIKPENIMVRTDGFVKVLDFGLARHTQIERADLATHSEFQTGPGAMLGTPSYMSPEQLMGQPVDGRSDLFSAGVVLYQFLTGEKPFTGERATTIITKVLSETPPAPSQLNVTVPRAFDALVSKALAKRPDERFQNGREFIAALDAAYESRGDTIAMPHT